MNRSPKSWMSRVGLGVIVLGGVAAIAGCGTGSLPSEMKEQKGGTQGDGGHTGQTTRPEQKAAPAPGR